MVDWSFVCERVPEALASTIGVLLIPVLGISAVIYIFKKICRKTGEFIRGEKSK